jgi:hypothetical protein
MYSKRERMTKNYKIKDYYQQLLLGAQAPTNDQQCKCTGGRIWKITQEVVKVHKYSTQVTVKMIFYITKLGKKIKKFLT